MTIKKILLEAKVELMKLKRFATKTEWSTLLVNIPFLDGGNRRRCIYGIMTGGSCDTPRSIELIKKCSAKLYFTDMHDTSGSPAGCLTRGPIMHQRRFSLLETALSKDKASVLEMIRAIA